MTRKGERFQLSASGGASPEQVKFLNENPFAITRGSITGRVALEGRTIQVADVLSDPDYTKNVDGHRGFRTTLGIPLLREGLVTGVIVLTRSLVQPFSDKQIELVETFADQAVIAINNVGLFEEVQARTAELQKSLEYQTATSDVLGVISRAPSQIQPVLDAIVAIAGHLCEAHDATLPSRLMSCSFPFYRSEPSVAIGSAPCWCDECSLPSSRAVSSPPTVRHRFAQSDVGALLIVSRHRPSK